jgi:hypothetical protein
MQVLVEEQSSNMAKASMQHPNAVQGSNHRVLVQTM